MATSAGSVESERQKKEPPRWAAYLFGAAVFVFLLGLSTWLTVGALHSRADSRPIAGGVEVTGKVVDVDRTSDSTYSAVIEFTDSAGRRYAFTGPSGEQEPGIGEPARVSYDPHDPSRAHDLTFNHASWKWPFWTGVSSIATTLLFALLAVAVVLRQRARAGSTEPATAETTPLPQTHTDQRLSRAELGRLIGLWVPAVGIWIAWPFVDLPVATPIAMTTVAVVLTAAILLIVRRRKA